jgi:hypothetical protein
MSIGFWFWLVWVIWFLFGSWWIWWPNRFVIGGNFMLLLLLGLLGWKAFGSPLAVLVH